MAPERVIWKADFDNPIGRRDIDCPGKRWNE